MYKYYETRHISNKKIFPKINIFVRLLLIGFIISLFPYYLPISIGDIIVAIPLVRS